MSAKSFGAKMFEGSEAASEPVVPEHAVLESESVRVSEGLLPGQCERLDYADRWMRSGVEACAIPGFFWTVEANMDGARKRMDEARSRGERITVTGLIVYAVARALDRHPAMQLFLSNSRRCRPERINVAVSVSGGGCDFVAPVAIIKDASHQTPSEITADIARLADQARAAQLRAMHAFRKWGWMVPFAWLRRLAMRHFFVREQWRNPNDAPLFHVTGTGDMEWAMPMILLTPGILGVGQMKEKAVVADGEVRAGWRLALSGGFDHRVWVGQSAARFLNEIKRILEEM